MKQEIQIQAKTVDLAIEKALVELGANREDVDVEVLSKGGLFSQAEVKVTVRETIKDAVSDFINGTLERMGLVSRATVTEQENTIYVAIEGEDTSTVIGYRGDTLDAFQYLALTFVNERKCDFKKVVIDCENYREKRKETLSALALRLADKAYRLRRKIALEPMNPFERRIIHSALADSTVATTESEGEEPARHIVITPVGVELKDSRPIKNGERDGGRDGRGNRGRQGRGRNNRHGGKPRDRKPSEEGAEAPDGNVYRGYYTEADEFVRPEKKAGPPKYKSFGGKKRF